MAVGYRICDWDAYFENASSRKLKRLDWIGIPNKMDGSGYTALVDHPNGAAHFGAWVAIVEIASKQKVRGVLPADMAGGVAKSLARISRLPESIFFEVLSRLVLIGWLEEIPDPSETHAKPQISHDLPRSPTIVADNGLTGHGRELQGREWKGTTAPPQLADLHLDLVAEKLYARHPKKKDRALVGEALIRALQSSENPPALIAEIERVHILWCQYPTWQEKSGQYVQPLPKWIEDRGWTQEPVPDHKPNGKAAGFRAYVPEMGYNR